MRVEAADALRAATGFVHVLAARVSVRDFRADSVPEETVAAIVQAARRAPTSSDLQSYSILRVMDTSVRQHLARLAGNQQHVADAPVFLVFCADLSRVDLAASLAAVDPATDTVEMTLVAAIDAALVGMAAAMTAESLGLGTVMIGGLRNDPLTVARLLNLPRHAFAVFGLCAGWPRQRPAQKPRLPSALVVHGDRHEGPELLQQHVQDPEVSDWVARAAKVASTRRRAKLRAELEALGFGFR